MDDNNDNITNMQLVEQKAAENNSDANALTEKANKSPKDFMDDYNQQKDADLSDVELGGRHILIKAPHRKSDSGLILSEKAQKELQSVQDTPGFQEDIYAVKVSEKCEFVYANDMVMLSPHTQTLEIDLPAKDSDEDNTEKVLYIMIHEDYVLMRKPKD